MNVRLHLVCAPWSHPAFPSIQLGCLKAYVDKAFQGQVPTFAYSAHLALPYSFKQHECFNFFSQHVLSKEDTFFGIFYRRYISPVLDENSRVSMGDLVECFNQRACLQTSFSQKMLKELEQATIRYIDREIVPNLDPTATNVIGFTLNYDQFYSSAFIARYLEETAPRVAKVFLWGGYGASTPLTARLMKTLGLRGYRVLGEGERKLEFVIRKLRDSPRPGSDPLGEAIEGLLPIETAADLFAGQEAAYRTQFSTMEDLPTPDFDEYFERVQKYGEADPIFNAWVRSPRYLPLMHLGLIVEGTRGCFAHCDFCSLNSIWKGFRKLSPEKILARIRELSARYGVQHIRFTDNVCDTWAERLADELIHTGERYSFFMELRAHHPEKFWTKLMMAGVEDVQIGTEALSGPLLKKIGKGTRVLQNVAVQKYLAELGIGRDANNLITHHPKSMLSDVAETKRVLMAIPHLGRFRLCPFALNSGSPIYESLSDEEKKGLKPACMASMPAPIRSFVASYDFEMPKSLQLPAEVTAAWDDLTHWYASFSKKNPMAELRVEKRSQGRLEITDRRSPRRPLVVLEGIEARVYEACHKGGKPELLEEELCVSRAKIAATLEALAERGLVLRIEDTYLSLALRPKAELTQAVFEQLTQRSSSPTEAPTAMNSAPELTRDRARYL